MPGRGQAPAKHPRAGRRQDSGQPSDGRRGDRPAGATGRGRTGRTGHKDTQSEANRAGPPIDEAGLVFGGVFIWLFRGFLARELRAVGWAGFDGA